MDRENSTEYFLYGEWLRFVRKSAFKLDEASSAKKNEAGDVEPAKFFTFTYDKEQDTMPCPEHFEHA